MDNIPNKTDGVTTLADSEFNSHKNELQELVTEAGLTLAIGTTDQLRKAISIFSRALYAKDSSGAANTLTLSRPTALTDTNAYYNGLTVIFDTPNANTGATTATLNGLASKKVLRSDDTDLIVGDILPGVTYTLVYNTALDTTGAFELKEIGAKLWDKQTITHDMTADDNYTLTAEQDKFGRIIITDTNPFLTVPKNIIVSDKQKDFIAQNDTLQTLTFKTSGGTGIAVTAGAKVWLLCDGTNVIDAIDAVGLLISSTAQAQAQTDNTTAISPLRLAEALQGANQSLSSNGYQKLPGGMIIQWGNVALLSTQTLAVSLPLTFPTAALVGVGTSNETGTSGAAQASVNVTAFSTTTITVNNTGAAAMTARWIAIGH